MKNLLTLLLCAVLLCSFLSACSAAPDAESTEKTAVSVTQASDIPGINYKGLSRRTVTLEDVKAVEGREPDFVYSPQENTTFYIYNDVTMDGLSFSQVQFFFGESFARASCAYIGDDPDGVLEQWKTAMTDLYGESTESDGVFRWEDSLGNYCTLCIEEGITQLAIFLCRE